MFRHVLGLFGCAMLAVGLAGCSNSSPESPTGSAASSSSPAPPKVSLPDGGIKADQAVNDVLTGLKAGEPHKVWEALPPTYRTNINNLISNTARMIDKEVWASGASALQKTVDVLKTKREFVMTHPLVKAQVDADPRWAAGTDKLVTLLETVAQSDLADLQKLEKFDGQQFLSTTGHGVMSQVAGMSTVVPDDPTAEYRNKLEQVRVSLVSEQGGVATVRIESPDSPQGPNDVPFVVVEGKWVPKNIADGWASGMLRGQMVVASFKSQIDVHKEQIMQVLGVIHEALDKMQAADTEEKFHLAMSEAMAKMTMALTPPEIVPAEPAETTTPTPGEQPAAGQSVTIVVAQELVETASDEMAKGLEGITDDSALSVVATNRIDGQTKFIVSPVGDIDAFAKKITFGKVTEVNAEERRIVVELSTEAPAGETSPQ